MQTGGNQTQNSKCLPIQDGVNDWRLISSVGGFEKMEKVVCWLIENMGAEEAKEGVEKGRKVNVRMILLERRLIDTGHGSDRKQIKKLSRLVFFHVWT